MTERVYRCLGTNTFPVPARLFSRDGYVIRQAWWWLPGTLTTKHKRTLEFSPPLHPIFLLFSLLFFSGGNIVAQEAVADNAAMGKKKERDKGDSWFLG